MKNCWFYRDLIGTLRLRCFQQCCVIFLENSFFFSTYPLQGKPVNVDCFENFAKEVKNSWFYQNIFGTLRLRCFPQLRPTFLGKSCFFLVPTSLGAGLKKLSFRNFLKVVKNSWFLQTFGWNIAVALFSTVLFNLSRKSFFGYLPLLRETKKCRFQKTPEKKLKVAEFTKIWLVQYICDVFSSFVQPFLKGLFFGCLHPVGASEKISIFKTFLKS